MSRRSEPPAFVELLRECITTFEELELVLALMRRPDRSAPAEELASELKLSEPDVIAAASRLSGTGLLRLARSTVILEAHDPRYLQGLEELQVEYAANRTHVMALMTENSVHRLRTSALRAFARAFVLRTKDDG